MRIYSMTIRSELTTVLDTQASSLGVLLFVRGGRSNFGPPASFPPLLAASPTGLVGFGRCAGGGWS
jgi:hypothetical protein